MTRRVHYTYGFIVRGMCAGTGLDPEEVCARQLVALARTLPENFPCGLTVAQCQYMIDNWTRPMPEEDIIESDDALPLRPDMSGEGEVA